MDEQATAQAWEDIPLPEAPQAQTRPAPAPLRPAPPPAAEPEEPARPRSTADQLADLETRHAEVVEVGEARAQIRQHAKGKLSARERMDLLFDPGSFVEFDEFVRHRCNDFGMGDNRPYGDGVVTGYGTVDGRQVCAFSQDFTTLGGSMGEAFGGKVIKIMDLALKIGCPIVGINDSGGARIQEGVVSLAYYAELGRRNVAASGVIPQISVIVGPCAGGAVYSPALTDITVMVEDISYMFVTGPEIVAAVTGERTSAQELGGPGVNSQVSGNAHYVAASEREAMSWVRDLLGYLPSNNLDETPVYDFEVEAGPTERDLQLDRIIPDSANQAYDMYEIIRRLVDDDTAVFPIQADFARNMICALATIEGHSVGIVANQPMFQAGVLDIDASEKAARFVRFCDAFNIPVLTLVDVPGYMPGIDEERRGIIRRGAKLPYAYAEATVPLVTVLVNKAYGGGYAVMGSKHLGADLNLAWPSAQVAVVGSKAAVPLLHRKALGAVDGPDREKLLARLTDEYERKFNTPYLAAERGYIDMVIRPSQTRELVASALRTLRQKRADPAKRKHSNMPI